MWLLGWGGGGVVAATLVGAGALIVGWPLSLSLSRTLLLGQSTSKESN